MKLNKLIFQVIDMVPLVMKTTEENLQRMRVFDVKITGSKANILPLQNKPECFQQKKTAKRKEKKPESESESGSEANFNLTVNPESELSESEDEPEDH